MRPSIFVNRGELALARPFDPCTPLLSSHGASPHLCYQKHSHLSFIHSHTNFHGYTRTRILTTSNILTWTTWHYMWTENKFLPNHSPPSLMTNCARGVMLHFSRARVLWGMIVETKSVVTNTPTGSHSSLLIWPQIWKRVDISTWWNRGTSDWNCILRLNCRKPSTWSCMRNLTMSSKWTKPATSCSITRHE